jgi:hypothetical protein
MVLLFSHRGLIVVATGTVVLGLARGHILSLPPPLVVRNSELSAATNEIKQSPAKLREHDRRVGLGESIFLCL